MKKHTPEELEEIFLDLISPQNFRSNFNTKKDFIEWLRYGSVEDLQCTLKKFVQAEMYEDCALIRDMIKRKKFKKLMK